MAKNKVGRRGFLRGAGAAAGMAMAPQIAAAQTAGASEESGSAWAWHKDAEGKTVAYVAMDATL